MEGYEYSLSEKLSVEGVIKKMLPKTAADQKENGLAVRAMRDFFLARENMRPEQRRRYKFMVSFYQIYNEKVYDLLDFDQTQFKQGTKGKDLKFKY